MRYTDFCDADQGSFSQKVDDPTKPPPPPCLSADGAECEYRIDEQAAYPSIPDRDIIAARHSGLKMCAAMRREFLARARHAGRPKIVARKPARALQGLPALAPVARMPRTVVRARPLMAAVVVTGAASLRRAPASRGVHPTI